MKVLSIFVSPQHNYFGHHGELSGKTPMVEVSEVECVAGSGLKGDRFFGFKEDYKGQVTFFSQQVYKDLCASFGVFDKPASAFRRNVLVDCEDLAALIGQEFEIQGIQFLGTQEASPCYWMNEAFCEGAEAALKGRGGIRAKILTSGVLRMECAEPEPEE